MSPSEFVIAVFVLIAGLALLLILRNQREQRQSRESRPTCLWCDHPEHVDTCSVPDDLEGITCGCNPADSLLNPLIRMRIAGRQRELVPLEEAARAVWLSWYTAMTDQRRAVAPERCSWDDLPEREKDLDRHIARLLAARWNVELEEGY